VQFTSAYSAFREDIIQAFYAATSTSRNDLRNDVNANVLANKDPHFSRFKFLHPQRDPRLFRLQGKPLDSQPIENQALRLSKHRRTDFPAGDARSPSHIQSPPWSNFRSHTCHNEAIYNANLVAGAATHTHDRAGSAPGPGALQYIWLIEKMALLTGKLIPERRMHSKGWGAYGPSR